MFDRSFFRGVSGGLLLSLIACGTLGACGADPSTKPSPADSAIPSAVAPTPSGMPNASGNSGASSTPAATSLPGPGEVIIPDTPPAVSTPAPSATEACQLAILGDPGSNPGANFAQWINARGPVVDRYLVGTESQAFTLARLSEYQVLLLDNLGPEAMIGITPSELATWVQGGGRVIALSGYGDFPEVVATQNRLLEPLGLGFVSETPVWGPVTQFAVHPITQGLTSLTFVGGREITHELTDEVIMSLNDMAVPVGVVAVRGGGRLFLFGDEWVTFDSEWAALPEIEQFWVNVFEWLGGCKLTPLPMVN
jgi:hypothetical protein